MAVQAVGELDPAKLDASDSFRGFRQDFWVPTNAQLDNEELADFTAPLDEEEASHGTKQSTYLCGNSLGLQPKSTASFVNAQLRLWQSKGVYGHFKKTDSLIPPWVDIDEAALQPMSRIVGAQPTEIAVMQTLSANLHILLSSFYRPNSTRYKILLEAKSFPSDHFVVESQLRHHHVNTKDGMILLEPPSEDSACLPVDYVLQVIDKHATELAVILLPGIQFYTGQLFDIERITQHAHQHGIIIGWDLAHAVGNVPLELHQWNVDFAAWCNYKYMNAGPGCIGSLFVHSRHTDLAASSKSGEATRVPNGHANAIQQRSKLHGWWGSTKASRFAMENVFEAMPGAAGFQLSNPSVLDISALLASLSVFGRTSMTEIREKSTRLTEYLENLLVSVENTSDDHEPSETLNNPLPYKIITPRASAQRGAQLSIRLPPAMLDSVMEKLEREHIVVDERKPDVIRVAPAPLYNTFQDCKRFADAFRRACDEALAEQSSKSKDESR